MNFTPLSTTMKCVINLTIQYMIIFTALGIVRTYLDLNNLPHQGSAVQRTLKHASETVFYAPMVCFAFIGFRMRVLQLSRGTDNPQEWVRMCMEFVAYAILANTLLVLVVPIFSKRNVDAEGKEIEEEDPVDAETGDLKPIKENSFGNPLVFW